MMHVTSMMAQLKRHSLAPQEEHICRPKSNGMAVPTVAGDVVTIKEKNQNNCPSTSILEWRSYANVRTVQQGHCNGCT